MLTFILIALYIFSFSKIFFSRTTLLFIFFASSIIFVYLVQTLLYSNPIGYSWTASSLYLVEVVALIIFGLSFQNFAGQVPIHSFGMIIYLLVLIGSKLVFFQEFIRDFSKTIFLSLFLLTLCFFILRLVLFVQLNKFSISYLIIVGLFLISFSFLRNSSAYGLSEGGMQDSNPRKYYETISSEREILLALSKSNPSKLRIWLTPENKVALVSSQLYAYSLISRTSSKPDCDQVNWARQSNSLIVSLLLFSKSVI